MGIPRTRLNGDWSILSAIGPVYEPHVVIDVGAHHGWFFHCWQDWCPEAVVHAFEPARESFEKMQKLYGRDSNVHLVQAGVGSKNGDLVLNVLQQSKISNSFLKPTRTEWDAIEYVYGAIDEQTVPVLTLNDYCGDNGIDSVYLVKIDVQGYELEVLEGAGEILKRTDYIFVESGIRRLYEGAPSFAEVHIDLEKRGFHLMTMRAWHRGNRRLVETDMLFRRNDLAPDIDREQHRHYLELR